MSPTYTVAIDLSKHKHRAIILETIAGRPCKTVSIPVNRAGFQQFQ